MKLESSSYIMSEKSVKKQYQTNEPCSVRMEEHHPILEAAVAMVTLTHL